MLRGKMVAFFMALVVSVPVFAQVTTKGLWNFDDGEAGVGFFTHGTNVGFVNREGAVDLSGNDYHMKGWNDSYGPKFSADGVATSGFGLSAQFSGNQDGYCDYADFKSWSPLSWTMEFSFNLSNISGNKTLIGRDGSAGYSNANLAALYVQVLNGSRQLKVQYVTASNELIQAVSTPVIDVNKWYHVAITCDGNDIKFYFDLSDESGLVLKDTIAITEAGGTIGSNHSIKGVGDWLFGQGWWGGGRIDKMTGFLDDIRISDGVVAEADFLQNQPMLINPQPAVGDPFASAEGGLSWDPVNASFDHYKVMISSDPNDWTPEPNTFEDAFASGRYLSVTNSNVSFTSNEFKTKFGSDFIKGQTFYKWQVYGYLTPSGDPIKSGIGSFTTAPFEVVILSQPNDALANKTAQMTVSASSAKRYSWHKEGEVDALEDNIYMTGTNSQTLTFDFNNTDAATAAIYEGKYYCVMHNGLTPEETTSTETSESAMLLTARMLGYWNFNDGLTDSVAGNNAVVTNSNSSIAGDGDLAFVDGVGVAGNANDKAVQFTNDSDFLSVPVDQDDDIFNYYPLGFTYSFWYQYNGPEITDENKYDTAMPFNWRIPMSKFDEGSAGWLFGINLNRDLDKYGLFIAENTGTKIYGNSSVVFDDAQWRLITITYDSSAKTITVYKDGVPSAAVSYDFAGRALPAAPLSIGGRITGQSVHGLIDEVKVYSYPITQEDIAKELYAFTGRSVCYEGRVEKNTYSSLFDFDNNCKIDLLDFAQFANHWLDCARYPECVSDDDLIQ